MNSSSSSSGSSRAGYPSSSSIPVPVPNAMPSLTTIDVSQTEYAQRLIEQGLPVQMIDLRVLEVQALQERLDREQEHIHTMERRDQEHEHELALLEKRGPHARELIRTVSSSLLQIGCLGVGAYLTVNGAMPLGAMMLGGVVYTFAESYVMKMWKKIS